jgi:hypothetical protein
MIKVLLIIYIITIIPSFYCAYVLIKELILEIKEIFISYDDLFDAFIDTIICLFICGIIFILTLFFLMIPILNYKIAKDVIGCYIENPFNNSKDKQ